jgi:peptidyl-prolyl cis-trans isomerase C
VSSRDPTRVFRPQTRWCGLFAGALLAVLMGRGIDSAIAQKAAGGGGEVGGNPPPPPAPARTGKSPVSPVAPGDLTRPAFDTTTRDYSNLANPTVAGTTPVAEVEGSIITLADVREAMDALPPGMKENNAFEDLFPAVLEKLVKEQALVVRARREGLDQEPEYKRKVRSVTSNALANLYLRRELERQVTEAMILERYKRDYVGKPGRAEVRVRLIQTDTEEKARDIITKLRGGEDFATLARQVSLDQTAAAGGDSGYVTMDQIVPQASGIIAGLVPGQLAPTPVRAGSGWLLLKLEDRREQPPPPFAAVRDALRDQIMRERVEPFAEAAEDGLTIRRYGFIGPVGEKADSDGDRSAKPQ